MGFDVDKFKPIGNFFSGKTQSPSHDILDMMALLVDFEPRPLGKFLERNGQHPENDIPQETTTSNPSNETEPPKIPAPQSLVPMQDNPLSQNPEAKFTLNKKFIIIGLLALCTIIGLFTYNRLTAHKDCLEWQNDRYVEADCKTKVNGSVNLDILYDESLLNRRKITPTDTTTYFKNGKPVLWYCKDNNGNLELFNFPGFHPLTGKNLRPITDYMINKYLKK